MKTIRETLRGIWNMPITIGHLRMELPDLEKEIRAIVRDELDKRSTGEKPRDHQ